MNDELLTALDVAKLGGVAPSTVRFWADTKRVPVLRTAGGVRLFYRSDVVRLLRRRARSRRGTR
jgi:DNA-binding transcriptional MerR regulator